MTAGRRTLSDMSTRQKPVKWWQVAIGAVAALAVAFAAIALYRADRAALQAQQEAIRQAEIVAAQQAEYDALVVKFSAPTAAEIVKTPPPPPPPAPVEEPVYEESDGGGYVAGQSGDPVPFVPSSDPNNASGGDYIDPGIYCLSGSASGNPPVCD